jgi:hypothetical protein
VVAVVAVVVGVPLAVGLLVQAAGDTTGERVEPVPVSVSAHSDDSSLSDRQCGTELHFAAAGLVSSLVGFWLSRRTDWSMR